MKAGARFLRIIGAGTLLLMLGAARISVEPLPQTIVPVAAAKLNQTITVREGDVVLRAKIYDTEIVTLNAPVSVSIAKFSHDLESGARLDPVLVPDKTAQVAGSDSRIYCGENQRTRSKFMDAMLGDWFSKYETIVRFCFVDTDNDAKLDQVFLAGAKDKADQKTVSIPPTPYATRFLSAEREASTLELRVHKIKARKDGDRIEFKLFLTRNGENELFDFILTVKDEKVEKTYPSFETNPKKLAYPVYFPDILGAEVGISRVNAKAGEADISVKRRFNIQMFKPIKVQVNYVFIYY